MFSRTGVVLSRRSKSRCVRDDSSDASSSPQPNRRRPDGLSWAIRRSLGGHIPHPLRMIAPRIPHPLATVAAWCKSDGRADTCSRHSASQSKSAGASGPRSALCWSARSRYWASSSSTYAPNRSTKNSLCSGSSARANVSSRIATRGSDRGRRGAPHIGVVAVAQPIPAYRYDDGVHTASRLLLDGYLPYSDFSIVHPPGVSLVLLPAAVFGYLLGDPIGMVAGRFEMQLVAALNIVLVIGSPHSSPVTGRLAADVRWSRPSCTPSCRTRSWPGRRSCSNRSLPVHA